MLIHPRVVLTAGHCVCEPLQGATPEGEGRFLVEPSTCAETATIRTVAYEPIKEGADDIGSRVDAFRGRVRAHPELKIVRDARDGTPSSRADLALIFLDEPVESLRLMPLADTKVHVGEPLVVVGYGYDELSEGHDGDRRFSRNRVIRVPTPQDERIAFEQPGRHLYRGDSGGPCLREGARGPELVGISSRSMGEGATCTSLHPYRDWLRTQVP